MVDKMTRCYLLTVTCRFTTLCNQSKKQTMEQHTLKNVNNCLNANIYSYTETSGGQHSNLYLIVHFFNSSVN